jgi:hypothetical protein
MMTLFASLILPAAFAVTGHVSPCEGNLAPTGFESRVIEMARAAYPDFDRHPEATIAIYNHIDSPDGGRVYAVLIEHLDDDGTFFDMEQRIVLVRVDEREELTVVAEQRFVPPPRSGTSMAEVLQFGPVHSPTHGTGVVAEPRALPGCLAYGIRLQRFDHSRLTGTSEGLENTGSLQMEGSPENREPKTDPLRGILRQTRPPARRSPK